MMNLDEAMVSEANHLGEGRRELEERDVV